MNELSSNSRTSNHSTIDPAAKPSCIVLTNGAELVCYPQGSPLDSIASDGLQLDATNTYLSINNKPCESHSTPTERERQEKLFTDNAFYLLAHTERIMRDSRMFLTPVAIQSGLAYTGTSGFRNPTVGIYLEWWAACSEAVRIGKDGQRSLVFHLAGSPLSGSNRCSEVYEDGKVEIVRVSPFINYWRAFTSINTRYDEAKQVYQAYTLDQLLGILHAEDDKGEE